MAFLRKVPLLKGLDDTLLRIVTGIMDFRRLEAGNKLFSRGDRGDACFVVAGGRLEVLGGKGAEGEEVLAVLGPGHVVGEVALIDGKRRSATVRCRTNVSVFALGRSEFDQLVMARNPGSMSLLDAIACALAQRLRGANDRYLEIFSKQGQTIERLTQKLQRLESEIEADQYDDLDDAEITFDRGPMRLTRPHNL